MNKKWLAILLGGIIIAITLSAFPAVSTTLASIVTCASTAPCEGGSNTSTGPGVQGNSAKGSGVYGTTKNTSATIPGAGVLGNDLTTINTGNAGVRGTSNKSNGVFGSSVSGVGVSGRTTGANPGVAGYSSGSPSDAHTAGVYGYSANVGVGGGSS